MTANRKAELQRKLTLAPVAKPPAGLAERIKREIPKELRFNVESERERLSKAVAFNLRVAASILILVSSAYLGLQLLSRIDEKQKQPAAQLPAGIPVATRAQPKALTETAAPLQEELQRAAAPTVAREKRAAKRDRPQPTAVASAPPPAAAPLSAAAPPAQADNAVAESITVSGNVAMDRVEKKAAMTADAETTLSPVSGKEMRYSAKDKNVQIVTSKLRDERITPWASVSPAAKLKILETELAAGADKKVIARLAREAGLTVFAESIEKR
jgi:hypothetical protein